MTQQEWLAKAKANQGKLIALVSSYHPGSGGYREPSDLFLPSAPAAEAACQVVREKIQQEEKLIGPSPVVRFTKALAEDNWREVYSLLDSTWFGVPESTSCWRLEGFSEAVDLLDDPPDIDDDLTGESITT